MCNRENTSCKNDKGTFELMLCCIDDYRKRISSLRTLFGNLESLYFSLVQLKSDWSTKFSNNLLNLDIVIALDEESLEPFSEEFMDEGVRETLQNKEKIIFSSIAEIEKMIQERINSQPLNLTQNG